jgi:hypothetical protein
MKKLSIFAVAAVFGLFAVSCNNGEEATDEETKTEEVKSDETQDEVAETEEEIVTTEADESVVAEDNKTVEKDEDVVNSNPKAQQIKEVEIDEKEVAIKGEIE